MGKKNKKERLPGAERAGRPLKKIIGAGLAAVVIIAGAAYWVLRDTEPKAADAALAAFAQCLTEKGAAMYGAYWCSHCQNQKKIFGDAFDSVNYVECTVEKRKCTDAGIKGYPTWIFADGSRIEGEMKLEELAEKTKCTLQDASASPEPSRPPPAETATTSAAL